MPASFPSLLYNALIRTSRLNRRRQTSWLWRFVWEKSCARWNCDVETTLHGKHITVNFGYPYPYIARNISGLNNPLVELVHQRFRHRRRPLTIVDVGAGLGDTVLLLHANCPGAIETMYCIEGERDFYRLLEKNVASISGANVYFRMLSSRVTMAPHLVRTHAGTASAVGKLESMTTTLDRLRSAEHFRPVDILKIDVDGYDGLVLAGAKKLLRNDKPDVIFEWHPELYKKTGNDQFQPFVFLKASGFSRFIFFTKYGEFSHFMTGFDKSSIETLAVLSLTGETYSDWHYDVVALHGKSSTAPVDLAKLRFARSKRAPF